MKNYNRNPKKRLKTMKINEKLKNQWRKYYNKHKQHCMLVWKVLADHRKKYGYPITDLERYKNRCLCKYTKYCHSSFLLLKLYYMNEIERELQKPLEELHWHLYDEVEKEAERHTTYQVYQLLKNYCFSNEN